MNMQTKTTCWVNLEDPSNVVSILSVLCYWLYMILSYQLHHKRVPSNITHATPCSDMPVSCLQELPEGSRVVRMMPNTPALVQNAASVFCRGTNTLPEDGETVHNIVSTFGICEEMEEKHLDAVTGLSGSGPAFVSKCIQKLVRCR